MMGESKRRRCPVGSGYFWGREDRVANSETLTSIDCYVYDEEFLTGGDASETSSWSELIL